jgi:hypothetical protein
MAEKQAALGRRAAAIDADLETSDIVNLNSRESKKPEKAVIPLEALICQDVTARALQLLHLLYGYRRHKKTDPHRGWAWPFQHTLAELLGWTDRKVRARLAELERAGWIEAVRRVMTDVPTNGGIHPNARAYYVAWERTPCSDCGGWLRPFSQTCQACEERDQKRKSNRPKTGLLLADQQAQNGPIATGPKRASSKYLNSESGKDELKEEQTSAELNAGDSAQIAPSRTPKPENGKSKPETPAPDDATEDPWLRFWRSHPHHALLNRPDIRPVPPPAETQEQPAGPHQAQVLVAMAALAGKLNPRRSVQERSEWIP